MNGIEHMRNIALLIIIFFILAGIYHDDYFTILTKEAEDIMSGIHSRMPVIVSFEDIDLWLDEGRVYKKTKDSLEVLGSHKQISLDDISDVNP